VQLEEMRGCYEERLKALKQDLERRAKMVRHTFIHTYLYELASLPALSTTAQRLTSLVCRAMVGGGSSDGLGE
jgi:hypothetical protein